MSVNKDGKGDNFMFLLLYAPEELFLNTFHYQLFYKNDFFNEYYFIFSCRVWLRSHIAVSQPRIKLFTDIRGKYWNAAELLGRD